MMQKYSTIAAWGTATALCGGWGGAAASAEPERTASATMAVTLQVVASCSVIAEPLDFGMRRIAGETSGDATAAIAISCSQPTALSIALDDGQNPAAGTRRVADPATGRYIAYDIYVDPAHQRRWGSGPGGSVTATTASGSAAQLTAYGRVDANAVRTAGSYADTVTVTVQF